VVDILDWLVMCHGMPELIRSDNGPEFVATKVKNWITTQGSQTIYIEPGHPWENPFIERFIGTLKHDCLQRYLFDNVPEAQELLDNWRIEYNAHRPHSALGYITPDAFATKHSQMIQLEVVHKTGARQDDCAAQSPIAQSAISCLSGCIGGNSAGSIICPICPPATRYGDTCQLNRKRGR
jgi:hypothetical protein